MLSSSGVKVNYNNGVKGLINNSMVKYILLLIVVLGASYSVSAQNVSGTLKDSIDEAPLGRATVSILKMDSTTVVAETVSSASGNFSFTNIPPGKYILSVSFIGYNKLKMPFTLGGKSADLGIVHVSKNAEILSTIVVDATPPPVTMKGDTTQMAASQYKVNPDATTEDLIKKMPGITVDKQGNVTAQGEQVQKVTVDGRDFFGDDATATLRNLPAEIVDKIQVFDRLSDQAQLTGFDDGNTTKSINIVTKSNMRQGNFGRLFAGYGTDNTYLGGGNISFFNNARRISIVGLTNNVNQQNFSQVDLSGMSGGGGGGFGGGRGGFGGGGGGFSVGPQSGIAKTNALGVNYNDQWGKKIEATGSYFFNNSNVSNNQITNNQLILPDASNNYYDDTVKSTNRSFNNRANMRIRYMIDSSNTLLITAGGSFQNRKSTNTTLGRMTGPDHLQNISLTSGNLRNISTGYQINTNILYSHRFAKKGRSISLNFGTNLNNNTGENYNYSENDYFHSLRQNDTTNRFTDMANNTNNYRFNLEYTEPIAPNWQMQLRYNPSFQKSFADQEAYNYNNKTQGYTDFSDSLSNKFQNSYNTQNAGITIRRSKNRNMLAAGLSYQYSDLFSNRTYPTKTRVDYTFNNLLGNVFARFRFGDFTQLYFNYRGSVNSPSVTQLQDVINTTNPLFYSTGNPDLKQQYSNRLMTRFSYANRLKGNSFFANFFVTQTNNFVSNATFTARQDSVLSQGIILHSGSQLSKPVNLDGYYSINSFFNYSMPLKFIKTNLNMNGGFGYSRQPGMVNAVTNISNNYNYNVGAVLASNISEYVDFNINYSINFNNVDNTVNTRQNNNYKTQSAGISLNLLTKKGSFFQTDLSNQSYRGLSAGFNQSYWLWNAAVGQKFLKGERGELKLSVFDLLKQNQSISRSVTATQISDVNTQVLQQYFMLTFTYKLKNFGKPQPQNNRREFRGGYPGFMGGGH